MNKHHKIRVLVGTIIMLLIACIDAFRIGTSLAVIFDTTLFSKWMNDWIY